MGNSRRLNWHQPRGDRPDGWQFHLATSVATAYKPPTYNLVWQSHNYFPPYVRMMWKPQYALNYTDMVPTHDGKLSMAGYWQPCNKGQTFTLDPSGLWEEDTTAPVTPANADWLNVGKVDFKPGTHSQFIIVGGLDVATGEYKPIFVDKTKLPAGGSAKYRPQESVSWWLEPGNLTGMVFEDTTSLSNGRPGGAAKSSSTASWNFSSPDPETGNYEWSTTYTRDGRWVTTPGRPPSSE